MISDASAIGEFECEAMSLVFVIFDYYIIFKMNIKKMNKMNIENVLEEQKILKNKQGRHAQTDSLCFSSLFQVGSVNESVGCCQVLFCFCKFALLTPELQRRDVWLAAAVWHSLWKTRPNLFAVIATSVAAGPQAASVKMNVTRCALALAPYLL